MWTPKSIHSWYRSALLYELRKLIGVYDDPDYVHLLDVIDKRNTYLNVEVRCEGHTDDLDLPEAAEYLSNWELSSARSLSFVRLLSTYAGHAPAPFLCHGIWRIPGPLLI